MSPSQPWPIWLYVVADKLNFLSYHANVHQHHKTHCYRDLSCGFQCPSSQGLGTGSSGTGARLPNSRFHYYPGCQRSSLSAANNCGGGRERLGARRGTSGYSITTPLWKLIVVNIRWISRTPFTNAGPCFSTTRLESATPNLVKTIQPDPELRPRKRMDIDSGVRYRVFVDCDCTSQVPDSWAS